MGVVVVCSMIVLDAFTKKPTQGGAVVPKKVENEVPVPTAV